MTKELAKIVPTPEAEVDWRVGWGYLVATDEIQMDISMKIAPAIQSSNFINLQSYFAHLLALPNHKGLPILLEGLGHIIDDTVVPYQIGTLIPTLYLADRIAVVHFSLKASAKG